MGVMPSGWFRSWGRHGHHSTASSWRCSDADRHEVPVLPHPVAVAADVDDVAVVQQPLDEGRGHDLVAEHGAPFLEALVGGEHGGGTFVAGVDGSVRPARPRLEPPVGRESQELRVSAPVRPRPRARPTPPPNAFGRTTTPAARPRTTRRRSPALPSAPPSSAGGRTAATTAVSTPAPSLLVVDEVWASILTQAKA